MRKKQMIWKIVALALVLVLGLGQPIYSLAATTEETEVVPMSIDAQKTLTLSISSGTATASCKVAGDSGDVTKIVIDMYLQRKNSSGTWLNYKSWTGSKSSNIYTMTKTYSVTSGTYRVKARVVCYQGSTTETTYHYTGSKTY